MTKKLVISAILAVSVSGCEAIRAIAPQTVAGFEANGLIGAVDGATGAVIARCATLDGQVIRVAVDDLAAEVDGTDLVTRVRSARERACRIARSASLVADTTGLNAAEEAETAN